MHEALARASTLRLSVSLKKSQASDGRHHAVMHAPQRPGLARLLDRRRVDRPDLQAPLPEQLDAQGAQPGLRLLQPIPQSPGRQLGQVRLPGAHHGFVQRVPAPEMNQQHPQQVVRRLVLAQPLQSPRARCQIPPVAGKER